MYVQECMSVLKINSHISHPYATSCFKKRVQNIRWRWDLKWHVTVKWGNTFSGALFVTTTKSLVQCTHYTLCVAGLSCDQRIMEYTRYGYCNIHGYSHYSFSVDFIQTTAVVPPWHTVVTSLALVNAFCSLTVWTPANEYAKTAAMERHMWRSLRDIAKELGMPQAIFLEVQLYNHTTFRERHICFHKIVLCIY